VTLDDLRRNRNLLFWALHTLGWSAYLITQYLGALLYEKPTSYIKVVLAAAAGGFLLSAPLRYLYRRLWGQRFAIVAPAVLLAAWVVALGWRVVINSSYLRWVETESMAGEPWYGIFVGTLSSTYLLLCWSGLYFGIKYYEALQEQRESMLRASALAQEAQVKMLRYQLNPHFLFNTLNAISTLILDNQGKVANQAVGRLSDFLRYTLDQDPMKKVTLRQELDALNLYLGIEYYEALQEQRESMLRAAALAQEAQVKMLRYQLNPHFLFNTLNAISTLILDNQGKVANQAVGRLSDFLRYTLDQDPLKKVTLRQELDALNLYLGIEQLRFGDRLRLEFDIDEAATQALVPSMILQPLVENSLKYAVAPREEGGRLRIEAREDAGHLRLVVQDDGPGLPVGVELGAGRGVGFRNTRERLAVLYGDQQKLAVRFSRPGLRLEISLPFERATQPT